MVGVGGFLRQVLLYSAYLQEPPGTCYNHIVKSINQDIPREFGGISRSLQRE